MSFKGVLQDLGACAPGLRKVDEDHSLSTHLAEAAKWYEPSKLVHDFYYMAVGILKHLDVGPREALQTIFVQVNPRCAERLQAEGEGLPIRWPDPFESGLTNFDDLRQYGAPCSILWEVLGEHRKDLQHVWDAFVEKYGDHAYREPCPDCGEVECSCDRECEDCGCYECQCDESTSCIEEMKENLALLDASDQLQAVANDREPECLGELLALLQDRPADLFELLCRILPPEDYQARMLPAFQELCQLYLKVSPTDAVQESTKDFCGHFMECFGWWTNRGRRNEWDPRTREIFRAYIMAVRKRPDGCWDDVPYRLFSQLNDPTVVDLGGWLENSAHAMLSTENYTLWKRECARILRSPFTLGDLEGYWEKATAS